MAVVCVVGRGAFVFAAKHMTQCFFVCFVDGASGSLLPFSSRKMVLKPNAEQMTRESPFCCFFAQRGVVCASRDRNIANNAMPKTGVRHFGLDVFIIEFAFLLVRMLLWLWVIKINRE